MKVPFYYFAGLYVSMFISVSGGAVQVSQNDTSNKPNFLRTNSNIKILSSVDVVDMGAATGYAILAQLVNDAVSGSIVTGKM